MKLVSAALVVGAALAFATPVSAQAQRTYTSNNYAVFVDKTEMKFVRSVEFEATQTAQAVGGRGGAQANGGSVQLKLVHSRTSDPYFDNWLGDSKAPVRSVTVELRDPANKAVGAHEFQSCFIAKSEWKLDAASNAVATATWTLSCAAVTRRAS